MKPSPKNTFAKNLADCLANLSVWGVFAFLVWAIYSFFNPIPPKVSPETDYKICRTLLREMSDTKMQVEVDSVKSRAIAAKCSDTVINYRNKFPLDRYP